MYIHILFVTVRSQYKFIFDWNVVWTYDTQFPFIYHFHCLQYYINSPGSSKTLLIGQLLNYFASNPSIDLLISYKLWIISTSYFETNSLQLRFGHERSYFHLLRLFLLPLLISWPASKLAKSSVIHTIS